MYELGMKYELCTAGVRTGKGLPSPRLPSPFMSCGARAGGRSQRRQSGVLIGGLKKRIAETEQEKQIKKHSFLLVAGSGYLSAAEAPLMPATRRPCLLLIPVSVSALFALWAVVGVPTSVVCCFLNPLHGRATALFFVWLWLWLTSGKQAARHAVKN